MVRPPWPLLAAGLGVLPAGPVAAQAVAAPPSAASVTIYRDTNIATGDLGALDPSQGLALITETRSVTVPAGVSRIAFTGVADTLVPQTVALEGLPGFMVERNEDFDLLSPGSLVERSIGQTVRVVQAGPRRGPVSERQAVIRSGPDGVVLDFGGKLEALGCGGPPTRLVFDHVPAGLGDRPTFSVLADVPKAGRYTVKLSYLATGFSWSADYVARIRPDGRTLDLSGWLTLANKSAAGFALAPTQVVAGQLARDEATRPPEVDAKPLTPACWGRTQRVYDLPVLAAPAVERRIEDRFNRVEELVLTGSRKAVQSDLGDYKLYTLPEPTTVAARQTKQVAFLDQKAVPFERVYVYRLDANSTDPEDGVAVPDVVLRLQNKPQSGLGKPLPAGAVSVMAPGRDGMVLAGQQQIRDTPVGLPLELTLGRAMDVAVAPRVVERTDAGGRHRVALAVSVANDKPQPVTFELRQAPIGRNFQILDAAQAPVAKAGDQVWTLHLAPGQHAQLSYTIRYRD